MVTSNWCPVLYLTQSTFIVGEIWNKGLPGCLASQLNILKSCFLPLKETTTHFKQFRQTMKAEVRKNRLLMF